MQNGYQNYAPNTGERKENFNPCKVITGPGRLTFAFVWEPRKGNDDEESKYSTSFLIPKGDAKTLQKIENATQAAIQQGQEKGYWGANLPLKFKLPLRDGDLEAEEKGEEYRGHYFLNASSKTAPKIVDADINPIMDREQVYSGCYARLSINLYPFNSNGHKGIACGLNNIQKIADGEPMTTIQSNPEEDFADNAYSAYPAFTQAPGYPPAQQPMMQQAPGYPPAQPPMQQAPGYPPAQPPMQQVPGYPPAQPPMQQAPGYPPAQPPMQQAPGNFSDQVANAANNLPPDLFGKPAA